MTGEDGLALLWILQDLEPFMGMDKRTYSLKKEDIVTLPRENAEVLIAQGAAVEVGTPQISEVKKSTSADRNTVSPAQKALSDDDPCLAAALEWAFRGCAVIPIHVPGEDGACTCGQVHKDGHEGKHPRADLVPHGVLDASSDPELVRFWWKKHPKSGIGLATGVKSGCFAVDIDPPKGGSIEALRQAVGGNLPDTRTHRTGSDGRHILYKIPEDETIPSRGGLLPGIDVKGEGGYIILPPSLHRSGNHYELMPGPTEIMDPSPELLKLVAREKVTEKKPAAALPTVKDGHRYPDLLSLAGTLRRRGAGDAVVEAALRARSKEAFEHPAPDNDPIFKRIVKDTRKWLQETPQYDEEKLSLEEINKRAEEEERAAFLKKIADEVITWEEHVVFADKPDKKRVEKTPAINYPLFADKVSMHLGTISFAGEIWINQDGIYTRDYGAVKALVTDIINASGITHQIGRAVTEVKERVLNRNPCSDYPFNTEHDLIPVANGVIRISPDGKIDFLDHDTKYRFNYRLPVTYDDTAPTEPVMQVLRSWVAEEDVTSLVQFPAQALLQAQEWNVYKRAYLFEGEKDSGKSTYWLLIYALLGEDMVGNVDLAAIGKNRFAIASLEGKIVNFHDDLGTFPLEYLGPFKRVTGSVWHDIERKGKDRYSGLVTAVHAFTCNAPPILKDLFDEAFFSRWNYVVFINSFPEAPLWPARTYTPAFLSGFLNLILQVMIEIKKAGHLLHAMNGVEVQERWIYATEPVQRFVSEELEKAAGAWTATEEVWERWVQWAQINSVNPRTKTALTQRLAPLGIPVRQKGAGGKTRAYEGVILKNLSQLGRKYCIRCRQEVSTEILSPIKHPGWEWRDDMPDDAPNYGPNSG